ncbi:hypothetical protein GBAR_LOCUS8035 [Geodia barretti]|uniref:Uncharacterized protein n=1 Tax=Geodia barretti TaxID=519541 RepID=A0AA35RJ95_GEOBA|nr:hypothetical protein GBAR_LOCUS8035 [Geodia barretti]
MQKRWCINKTSILYKEVGRTTIIDYMCTSSRLTYYKSKIVSEVCAVQTNRPFWSKPTQASVGEVYTAGGLLALGGLGGGALIIDQVIL